MTFWRHGYEGASIADLTAAMGITPQSLYAAYSSKADLYREALDWYQSTVGKVVANALDEADVFVALAGALRTAADEFSQPDRPRGCMISTAVLTCAVENQEVAQHVASLRTRTIEMVRARIERGIAEGEVEPATDAEALARFVGAIIQGMSVQAQDGASMQELEAIAEHAVAEVERHRPSRYRKFPASYVEEEV